MAGYGSLIMVPWSNDFEPEPPLPDPLYPLADLDYAYRWEASRLAGADNSVPEIWRDVAQNAALSDTSASPRAALRNPGEGAYVEFKQGVTTILRMEGLVLPADFSYALLLRRMTGTVNNNGIRINSWDHGVAGNNTWQTAANSSVGGAGSVAGGSVPIDTWHVIQGSLRGSDPTATRHKVDGGPLVGPGTITAAPTPSGVFLITHGSTLTGSLHLASMVLWPHSKSEAQLVADYNAIVAGTPLL